MEGAMEGLDTGSAHACTGVRITPPDIFRHRISVWNGIRSDAIQLIRREPFAYEFRSPCHLLIMSERAEREDGETLVEGLPKSTLREFNRTLTFVPSGHQFFGWQKPRTLTQATYFYINPQNPLLDGELRFSEIDFKPRLFFFDRDIWETLLKLRAQSANSGQAQRQYAEALGIVLAHELVRLNDGPAPATPSMRGGLAAWQEKRVTQYIEEHLAEGISLSALAQVASLSPYHFSRAFKESLGLPPHRYLTARRMERARNLLADPELSVTRIGRDLGFVETSSFTTSFRKHVGITPTAYRRGLA
jgi:AraC family transcriptional regulator